MVRPGFDELGLSIQQRDFKSVDHGKVCHRTDQEFAEQRTDSLFGGISGQRRERLANPHHPGMAIRVQDCGIALYGSLRV